MHSDSEHTDERIDTPSGTAPAQAAVVPPTIPPARAAEPGGVYTGPERRAQGVLIAEVTGPVQETPIEP